jgi:hypothetical protein
MKKNRIVMLVALGTFLLTMIFTALSQETAPQPKGASTRTIFEYATARFMEEKTSIVWPDGIVENVMLLNGKKKFDNGSEKYPKGADYRMYWLTVSMNIMGQRGFEFVHMEGHDLVMKRQVMR